MSKQLFANNASALLAASINDTDLTIQVDSGYGALFPNPGAGEFFKVALTNASGDLEICTISARAVDLLTVSARGGEGTTAQSWTNGQTRVELRNTKGTMEQMVQRDGDALTGDLDFAGNEAQDARLTGDTVMVAGQLVGTAIRGTEDDGTNEILVPSDGTRATAGGERLLVESDTSEIRDAAFVVGQVIMWFGAALNIPAGWAICDGATHNGHATPDLRDKFVVGAGSAYALNDNGGDDETGAGGAHTHTVTTGPHALTIEEMPEHHHEMWIRPGGYAAGSTTFQTNQLTNSSTGAYEENNPLGAGEQIIQDTGGGEAHTHDAGSTSSDGSHTHTNLPPYRALYFIMYVGV